MTDRQIEKIKNLNSKIKALASKRSEEYADALPVGSYQEYRGNKDWIGCTILEEPYFDRVLVLNEYGRKLRIECYKFLGR